MWLRLLLQICRHSPLDLIMPRRKTSSTGVTPRIAAEIRALSTSPRLCNRFVQIRIRRYGAGRGSRDQREGFALLADRHGCR